MYTNIGYDFTPITQQQTLLLPHKCLKYIRYSHKNSYTVLMNLLLNVSVYNSFFATNLAVETEIFKTTTILYLQFQQFGAAAV